MFVYVYNIFSCTQASTDVSTSHSHTTDPTKSSSGRMYEPSSGSMYEPPSDSTDSTESESDSNVEDADSGLDEFGENLDDSDDYCLSEEEKTSYCALTMKLMERNIQHYTGIPKHHHTSST